MRTSAKRVAAVWSSLCVGLVLLGASGAAHCGEQADKAVAAVKLLIARGELKPDAVLRMRVKQGNTSSFLGRDYELQKDWEKQTGILLDVSVMPQVDSLAIIRRSNDIDLTIARNHEYPDLVAGRLIEDLTPLLQRFGFALPVDTNGGYMLLQHQAMVGDRVVAIPADLDMAMLFVRRDLLEDPAQHVSRQAQSQPLRQHPPRRAEGQHVQGERKVGARLLVPGPFVLVDGLLCFAHAAVLDEHLQHVQGIILDAGERRRACCLLLGQRQQAHEHVRAQVVQRGVRQAVVVGYAVENGKRSPRLGFERSPRVRSLSFDNSVPRLIADDVQGAIRKSQQAVDTAGQAKAVHAAVEHILREHRPRVDRSEQGERHNDRQYPHAGVLSSVRMIRRT